MRERFDRLIPGMLLWAVWVTALPAQEQGQLDGGTFEHSVRGSFAGTETFAIRMRGEDIVAVGRVTREGGPEALRSMEVGLRLDGSGRPVRYELHTREGPALHVIVNRTGSRLRVTTTSDEGERFTEFLARDRMLILEREIAHHYGAVARLLRAAADPRTLDLEVLVPTESRMVPLRVRGLSRDSLPFDNRTVPSTRYSLMVGDEETVVWVGTTDGLVLSVAIPERGWAARRVARP